MMGNGVDIKLINVDTDDGQALLEHANADQGFTIPIVMAGDRVIGQGIGALISLLQHASDNPHRDWEASDGEDGDF
jgi:hypothetical protein